MSTAFGEAIDQLHGVLFKIGVADLGDSFRIGILGFGIAAADRFDHIIGLGFHTEIGGSDLRGFV